MGISDADTAENLKYFRFIRKQTAHLANTCTCAVHKICNRIYETMYLACQVLNCRVPT